jgi:hypothetical protein
MLKFVWHPYLRTEVLLYDGKPGDLFLANYRTSVKFANWLTQAKIVCLRPDSPNFVIWANWAAKDGKCLPTLVK